MRLDAFMNACQAETMEYRNNDKLRILLVHNYYKIHGGEDTVFENERRLLEEHGHHVFLYTRSNSETDRLSFRGKLSLIQQTAFNDRTYSEVKDLIEREHIDLVHVHNTWMMVSASVFQAAYDMHVPVVQTLHNFRMACPAAVFYRDGRVCEECLKNGFDCAVKHGCYRSSRIQTQLLAHAYEQNYQNGTFQHVNFICLTEFNKEKLLAMNAMRNTRYGKPAIDTSRVFIKPNFVFPAESLQENRKNQYVYCGRLEEIKGVSFLLDAFRKMPDHLLYLAGDGPLLEKLQKAYPKENIRFLGRITHDAALKLIAESKALILPSVIYEGFPMTIAEAYSTGTPVLGSDLGNVGSLIEEEKTGMKFQPGSAESIVNTVHAFEASRVDWYENALQYYQAHLSPENNYSQLIQIYETMLKQGEN